VGLKKPPFELVTKKETDEIAERVCVNVHHACESRSRYLKGTRSFSFQLRRASPTAVALAAKQALGGNDDA
jgi:hypothetical protein